MGSHLSFSPDLLLYIEAGGLVEISFLKEILCVFYCSGFNFISSFFPVLDKEGTSEMFLGGEL